MTLIAVPSLISQNGAAYVCDGTAIRVIQDLMEQNQNHPFARHAEDFHLERLGRFNEISGDLETEPVGEVIKLRELVKEN